MDDPLSEITPARVCLKIGKSLHDAVKASKKAGIARPDSRKLFVTEHANNIAMLLGNICTMNSELQAYAVKLLVRPMYEGMFNMVAAIREPSFAQSKMLSECSHWQIILRDYRKKIKDKPQSNLGTLDNIIRELEAKSKEWQAANNAKSSGWKPWQICKAAECEDWYLQYQMLCDYTHAAFSTLNPFTNTTRGTILHQSSAAGAYSLHQYRMFIDGSKKEEHMQEFTIYNDLIWQMVNDGSYAKVQWERVNQSNKL